MSLLLLLFLTIACLPIDWPEPVYGIDREGSAILAGCVVAALLLAAKVFSRRTVVQLRRDPEARERVGRAHGQRRLAFFFMNIFGFTLTLLGGWGWTVKQSLSVNGTLVPGAELVILAPYFIALFGSWAFFFDAERVLHLSARVVRGPFWTRRGYLMFLFRQHLLMVLTPVFLMIAQLGVLRMWPELLDSPWAKLAAFLGLFGFILVLPSFVPLVLGLRPMPNNRLRQRLEAAAVRLGVRYRGLHIWDTRGNLATAMVTGLVPRMRHIVFTDLLLDTMSEDEIEAVFGHEVGHVKHGHLFYYAAFLMLSFLTLGASYRAVELAAGADFVSERYALVLTVLCTGTYLFSVFGFISRRCERQADVFGCKAVSCANRDCISHDFDTPLVAEGKTLCRTGVRTFVGALERVEEINGMARDSGQSTRNGLLARFAGMLRLVGVWLATWQHSTIQKRVAFLNTLPDNPGRESRFQFRVAVLRWGLLLLLSGGVIGVCAWKGWRTLLEGV